MIKIQITDDDELLDGKFRQAILNEIKGQENIDRKDESVKRFDIVKDNTKKYVVDRLSTELSPETVNEMLARTPNISLGKKIIDKKSQVYRDGSIREAFIGGKVNEDAQTAVDEVVDILNFDTQLKKTNKILELQKNSIMYIKPVYDSSMKAWKIKLDPLHPHFYDVVPDANDPETPRVVIFSYFNDKVEVNTAPVDSNLGGKRTFQSGSSFRQGDNIKQKIADSPGDEGVDGHHVWWSNKYHFTTNSKGDFIEDRSPDDKLNPIQMLPFVNFALDQDGSFWAVGGDDIVEGSIQINLLLADIYFIAKVQGMGIFYMFGTDVPTTVKWGPNNSITGKLEKDDPNVQIGFASSNPPLEAHMKLVEQFIALLLTTNNLEPGTVQGQLSAVSAASGIQEMIRKSEISGDIEDQRELFRDNEPQIFNIVFKWLNVYKENLIPRLRALGDISEDLMVATKFKPPQELLSEKEKLEIMAKRKDLGLDSMIDMIMRDDPSLTTEMAQERLLRLLKERLEESRANMQRMMLGEPDANNKNKGNSQDEVVRGEGESDPDKIGTEQT